MKKSTPPTEPRRNTGRGGERPPALKPRVAPAPAPEVRITHGAPPAHSRPAAPEPEPRPRRARMVESRSTVTCPHCGHRESEILPVAARQLLYSCKGCGAVLTRKGRCCVFCCCGSVPCRHAQEAG